MESTNEFKMSRVVWESRYEVNVREIDDQHRQLFALLNRLNEAIEKGEAAAVLHSTLESLLNYTKWHFSAEQLYMETYQYPDTAAHRKQHQRMIEKVNSSQKEYAGGNILFLCADLSHFVEEWIKGHILHTDQKLAPFLRLKGVM